MSLIHRRALRARAKGEDRAFKAGAVLWVTDGPDWDGRLGVLAVDDVSSVHARRHPTELDLLELVGTIPIELRRDILHWPPRREALPGWVGGVALVAAGITEDYYQHADVDLAASHAGIDPDWGP